MPDPARIPPREARRFRRTQCGGASSVVLNTGPSVHVRAYGQFPNRPPATTRTEHPLHTPYPHAM
jgi:hypothetical protein